MLTARPADDILAEERRDGPRAGLLAILAGIAVLVGNIGLQLVYADIPRVGFLDALRDSAGESIGREGLLTEKILFYNDKAVSLTILAIVQAAGVVCIGFALVYLHRAALGRGANIPRLAKLLIMLGAACSAVGYLALQIVATVLASDFAGQADKGTEAAHDALRSGVLVAAQFVGFIGSLSLALSFVLLGLASMRVGLLTRFMGILCVVVGVLMIIPLGPTAFVVEGFWLVSLGALYLGRWPRGLPPAWVTGEARPWPTQQELREARAQASGDTGGTGELTVDPEGSQPSPATSRKRRKRRG